MQSRTAFTLEHFMSPKKSKSKEKNDKNRSDITVGPMKSTDAKTKGGTATPVFVAWGKGIPANLKREGEENIRNQILARDEAEMKRKQKMFARDEAKKKSERITEEGRRAELEKRKESAGDIHELARRMAYGTPSTAATAGIRGTCCDCGHVRHTTPETDIDNKNVHDTTHDNPDCYCYFRVRSKYRLDPFPGGNPGGNPKEFIPKAQKCMENGCIACRDEIDFYRNQEMRRKAKEEEESRREKRRLAILNKKVCKKFNAGECFDEDECLAIGFYHPNIPCRFELFNKIRIAFALEEGSGESGESGLEEKFYSKEKFKHYPDFVKAVERSGPCRQGDKCTFSHRIKVKEAYKRELRKGNKKNYPVVFDSDPDDN